VSTTATNRVIQFPSRAARLVTKRQLAAELGRSERWIELKARDCGLPVYDTDRFGRKRYDLPAVEAWLRGAKRAPRRDRVRDLEEKVAQLAAQVAEMRRAS
jgi:hypothetical protein